MGGGNGSGGGNDDKRDVQHRYATSIIQKEIDETSEREIELVRHGKIQTTSIQRADSKVRPNTNQTQISFSYQF